MKRRIKIIGIIAILLVTIGSVVSVAYAQNSHKHSSTTSKQASDQFTLTLFQVDILKAVNDYYKKENVGVTFDWWNNEYDVVEIEQSEQENKFEAPYVVKFTVIPQDNINHGRNLGIDTITFGVVPKNQDREMKVKLLKYEHKELSTTHD